MPKAKISLTDTYQQIAAGAVAITIDTEGSGTVLFDEASSDITAYKSHPSVGDQFIQNEEKPTFARATGAGWDVIVDGVL